MSYNAQGLRFTAVSKKDKALVLRALNCPWGRAQEILKASGDKPLHVPMSQRIRELLNRRKNYGLARNTRRARR